MFECFVWPYEAETVFLSSDHDNWKSLTPLIKTEENANWHCILKFPAHKRIHFRFYVDSKYFFYEIYFRCSFEAS